MGKVGGLIFIQIDHLKWEAQSYKEYYTVSQWYRTNIVYVTKATTIVLVFLPVSVKMTVCDQKWSYDKAEKCFVYKKDE